MLAALSSNWSCGDFWDPLPPSSPWPPRDGYPLRVDPLQLSIKTILIAMPDAVKSVFLSPHQYF
jgi:hypothetical protein